MISLYKAIKTGKYTQLLTYKNPYEYGYQSHRPKNRGSAVYTEKDVIDSISANRAKNQLRRLIIGNMYHYKQKPVFLTLTFKDNVQNVPWANNQFHLFIKRLRYQIGVTLRYVAVLEFQERGAIHYHILLFNLPFIKGQEIQRIWTHGSTDIRLAYRGKGVFSYLTKYLTKSYKDPRLRNIKRYFHSLENKPQVVRNQSHVLDIKATLRQEHLISKSEYDVKDNKQNVINHITALDYLYTDD